MKNIVVFFILCLCSNTALGQKKYVSPSGIGSGSGNIGNPWHIPHMLTQISAGDTIIFLSGTYSDRLDVSASGNNISSTIYFMSDLGAMVIIAPDTPTVASITGNWLYFEGITFLPQNFSSKLYGWPNTTPYIVDCMGSHVTFNHCRIPGTHSYADMAYIENPISTGGLGKSPLRGISVSGKYVTVENCYLRGLHMAIVSSGLPPRYHVFSKDTIGACVSGQIVVTWDENWADPNYNTFTSMSSLIENCVIDSSWQEDNIQFDTPWTNQSPGGGRANITGWLIRNCMLGNAAENAIDPKGGAHIFMEHNIIFEVNNDDNGPWLGDNPSHGVNSGAALCTGIPTAPDFACVARFNTLINNSDGIGMYIGSQAYNNTLVNNRKYWNNGAGDYTHDNDIGLFGINNIAGGFPAVLVNNIIVGQAGSQNFSVGYRHDQSSTSIIDNNLYYEINNTGRWRCGTYSNGWTYNYFDSLSSWKAHLLNLNFGGREINSIWADPLFTNCPIHPSIFTPSLDVTPQTSSPAIDAGGYLTLTTNSGINQTTLNVTNSLVFHDGMGIPSVLGDSIYIASSGHKARITFVDYDNSQLIVTPSISWIQNEGVYLWPFIGNSPDIGAIEFSSSSIIPIAENNGPVCIGDSIQLSVSNISNATYLWTGPNGFTSTQQNPIVSDSATLSMAGTYSVTVTVNGNISQPVSTVVIVNSTPSAPTTGNNGPVTAGSSLSLTASPVSGATYSWTGPNGFASTQQNPMVSNNATSSMAGIYYVSAVVNDCYSSLVPTTVVVDVPCNTISIDTTSSIGSQFNLSDFSWNHTTSGSDRYLLFVSQTWEDAHSAFITSLTYAGLPAIFLGSQQFDSANGNTYGRIEFWGMTAPPLGNNAINISLAGTAGDFAAVAISFNNVDQLTPTGSFEGNSGQASINPATFYIPSSGFNIVVDALVSGLQTYTPGTNQSLAIGLDNTGNVYDIFCSVKQASPDSTFMSWAFNQGFEWGIGGIALKASAPPIIIATNNGPICEGSPLTLSSSSVLGATYSWTGPNGFSSILQNPNVSNNATFAMSGTYSVTAKINGCDSSVASTTASVNVLPNTPSVFQNGNDLISSSTTGNQWYNQNGAISGAVSSVYMPSENGFYYCIVTQNGCESQPSNTIQVITLDKQSVVHSKKLHLFPNPNDGIFNLFFTGYENTAIKLKISTILGQTIYVDDIEIDASEYYKRIDLHSFPAGIYYLNIFNIDSSFNLKIVIQN